MKYLLTCFLSAIVFNGFTQPAPPQFPIFKIGDTVMCGIVFYVEDSGKLQHGLVCSLNDVAKGIRWNNGSFVKTSAVADILFDRQNADRVMKIQDTGMYAASVAYIFHRNDSSGCNSTKESHWYLPSKAELLQMYQNLAVAGLTAFSKEGYWSSCEFRPKPPTKIKTEKKAWIVDFLNGKLLPVNKSNKYHVRAVREFWNNRIGK